MATSDEIDTTPPDPDDRTRRVDGARQPVSEAVEFRQKSETGEERVIHGWALNMSRGGLRAALEEPVREGEAFDIIVGDAPARPGHVVWVRNQKDGAIVGVSFDDTDGSVPPPPALESTP